MTSSITGGVGRSVAAGCVLVALGLSVGAPSASAAPAWLPATNLSAPGRNASGSAVAMDEAGDTVALWEREDGISNDVQASTRVPGGSFSAPIVLSVTSREPVVAMTPGGEAIAAWVHFENPNDAIEVATRPPGGSFSAPVLLASAEPKSNPQDLQLAVNSAGEAALAWIQKEPGSLVDPNQFSAWAAVGTVGAGFSTPAIVSPQPLVAEDEAGGVRVAIDRAGDVAAVWDYYEASTQHDVVQEATRPAGGSFSTPATLSEAGESASDPAVAMDSGGDAIALWARENGTNYIVQASTAASGGPFGAPVNLSELGENAFTPEIAMTPGGAATAVWTRNDGTSYAIQASTASPGAGFSTPITISASGENAEDPEVAVDAPGAATAIWRRSDGSNEIVQASTASPGGSFSSAVDLSEPGEDAVLPKVAMDGAGDATAVWQRSDGSNRIAQAASYEEAKVPAGAGGTISIPPSNRFTIGRLSLNRRKGTGTLLVKVPGPGKLVLSGKGVRKTSRRAKRAGQVKLAIRAQGATRRNLAKGGRARVKLAIAFTPEGGSALVKGKKVKLIEKPSAKRRARR